MKIAVRAMLSLLASSALASILSCQSPQRAAPPPREIETARDESAQQSMDFGASAPDWARTGRAGLPEDRFITGLGYSAPGLAEADAYDQARLQAFTDISTQIETYVESEFTSIQQTLMNNEEVQDLVDLKSISRQVSKETLPGLQVAKRYYDPSTGTACVLAVADRSILGERIQKEAEDARDALDGHFQGFEEARDSQDQAQALKNLVHAHRSMEKVIASHLKAIAVRAPQPVHDRMKELNDPLVAARIIRELGMLQDKIRIVPLSGDGQKAALTGRLLEPVVVRVAWSADGAETPIPAFPVRVEAGEKAAAVPRGQTTDQEGRFAFELQGLSATGSSVNTVTVRLDYQAVEKGSSLAGPSLPITYILPTRENTRIGVLIKETIDGEENFSPHTGSAIKDALTDLGFQVIRLEQETAVDEALRMNQAELAGRFAPLCDYLILGTAEAEYSSKVGAFEFYRSRLVIDALELSTGKTIHFEIPMDDATKGGSGTKPKAMRLSLSKAAGLLVGGGPRSSGEPGLLTTKFSARFEEGADWSE